GSGIAKIRKRDGQSTLVGTSFQLCESLFCQPAGALEVPKFVCYCAKREIEHCRNRPITNLVTKLAGFSEQRRGREVVALRERNMAQLPERGGCLPGRARIGGRGRTGKSARRAQPTLEECTGERVVGLLNREVGKPLQRYGQPSASSCSCARRTASSRC